MPKTQTKNPHPIIKILSDLNLLPEKGEDVDAKSYKRAVRTAIVTIESSSKDKAGEMEAKESKDLDATNAAKAIKHDCATHVEHATWGAGKCIPGEHTIVETSEGEGYVTHYDVMFEHGLERDVPVEEMKIIKSSSHGHMRKN